MNRIGCHLSLRSLIISLWQHVLKAEHVLVHVWLRYHIREILRWFRVLGVYYTDLSVYFVWTAFEAFDSTLKRLTSLLYTSFAIRFHQWRQSRVLVANCKFLRLQNLEVLGLYLRLTLIIMGKLNLARCYLQHGRLLDRWHYWGLFVVLHSKCR